MINVPRNFKLRVGMQLMCRINLNQLSICNGTRGVLTSVFLDANNNIKEIGFRTEYQRDLVIGFVHIKRKVFGNYFDNKNVDSLTYMTIPFCPAWAMTIHKSQGLTLNSIVLSLGPKDIFLNHQAYVALSRAKNLESIYLNDFSLEVIQCDYDARLFYEAYDDTATTTINKQDEDYDEINRLYDYDDYCSRYSNVINMGKFKFGSHSNILDSYHELYCFNSTDFVALRKLDKEMSRGNALQQLKFCDYLEFVDSFDIKIMEPACIKLDNKWYININISEPTIVTFTGMFVKNISHIKSNTSFYIFKEKINY